MKIVVNYDDSTGNVNSLGGVYIGTCLNIHLTEPESVVTEDPKPSVSTVIKLRDVGFDHEAIIEMFKAGLI